MQKVCVRIPDTILFQQEKYFYSWDRILFFSCCWRLAIQVLPVGGWAVRSGDTLLLAMIPYSRRQGSQSVECSRCFCSCFIFLSYLMRIKPENLTQLSENRSKKKWCPASHLLEAPLRAIFVDVKGTPVHKRVLPFNDNPQMRKLAVFKQIGC